MIFMREDRSEKKGRVGIPPWIILGAVIVLVPIFVFWTAQNIHKQKESMTLLLLEKGAALIRSFEAGTRTGMMGMMGMHGSGFQLQKLTILAHNDPAQIGEFHGRKLDLGRISRSQNVVYRQVSNPNGESVFEVFRRFSPTRGHFPGHHRMMMRNIFRESHMLDMGPIEAARKADTRHTLIMALILLLIGFAGMVSLFLAQAYRSAKTSLTRIKAFSDNVVENMPIGLLAIDTDKRIVSFNQTAELVLQARAHEVLGKKADEVLPQQLECLTGELETEEEVIEKEIECPVAYGRKIPMDVSVSRLEDDNGISLGQIILFRDLTSGRDTGTTLKIRRRRKSWCRRWKG
jgi:two-component system sensor histidine kinase HydH